MPDHRRVTTIAQHSVHLQIREAAPQLSLDVEHQQFADFQHDNTRGAMASYLTAKLGADRSAATGDKHGSTAQPAADQFPVREDGFAPQQVLDRHFLELTRQ
ncbi:hypothetical protein D9M71_815320 [compost metagenome]